MYEAIVLTAIVGLIVAYLLGILLIAKMMKIGMEEKEEDHESK
ncbi:MAG: hypothetical protein ABFD82_18420 [Syntrophaceae bacterium]